MALKRFLIIAALLATPVLTWAVAESALPGAIPKQSLQVNISGTSGDITDNLRQALTILQTQSYALSSPLRLRNAFHQGISQIHDMLQSYGYFKAQVSGHLQYYPQDHTWIANYNINLGPQLKVTQFNVTIVGPGKSQPAFEHLAQRTPLQIGEPLIQKQYTAFKNNLQNLANNLGYFDAKLTQHEILIDLTHYTAIINVTLKTGERYQLGAINLIQRPDKFDDSFLDRFIPKRLSGPYNQHVLNQLEQNLNDSNYFASVNVTPNPNSKTKVVPVNVTLIPQKPFEYSLGVGYGTDTGPRGLLGFTWRYVTRTGQYFTSQFMLSKIYNIFSVAYVIPGDNPLRDKTSIVAVRNNTNIDPYDATQMAFGVSITKAYGNFQLTTGIEEHFIRYNTDANSTTERRRYLLPNAEIQYLRRFPKHGNYWANGYSFDITGTGTYTIDHISSQSLLEGTANFKQTFSLTPSTRFFSSYTAGGIAASNLQNIAPTLLFYAGGQGSIRGFDYLSQGPTNSAGKQIGGRYLALASFNLEQRVFGHWSVLGFMDTGNAFLSLHHMKFQKAAGFGISWRSPIGAITAYMAHPIHVPGSSWNFDVSMGTFLG